VALEFDDASFVEIVAAGDTQVAEAMTKFGIEAEAAVVALDDIGAAVSLGGERSRRKSDWQLFASNYTNQSMKDEDGTGGRIVLRVGSVGDAEHIACMFENDVLESGASSAERNIIFTSEADGRERAFHAVVGAAGSDPESVEGAECGGGDLAGGQPGNRYLEIGVSDVGEEIIGDGVGFVASAKVSDDGDSQFHSMGSFPGNG